MLLTFTDLRRTSIQATDDALGAPTDFLYRDDDWRVVFAVADVGSFFISREILLRIDLLGPPDMDACTVNVDLTRDQIAAAPELETNPPVSAQQRASFWPSHFLAPVGGAYSPYLTEMFLAEEMRRRIEEEQAAGGGPDPHLRSMAEAVGYAIEATDGRIGSVEDFLIDAATWRVKYLAVDTGTWLPGKKVVLSVDGIDSVSFTHRSIRAPLDMAHVESATPLSSLDEVKRAPLAPLHQYYGYPMV